MSMSESRQAMDAERELEEIKTRFIQQATISDMEEILAQTVDMHGYDQYHTNIMFHFKAVSTCNIEDEAEHAVKYHNASTALYLKYHDDAIQEEFGEWKRINQKGE